jgi:hypothetical protein
VKIIGKDKSIPGLKPEIEFNIVHTWGVSDEVFLWLTKTFEPSDKGRWFIINRSIYFKYERDYIWFSLHYS